MSRSTNAGTAFIMVALLLDTLGVGLIVPVGPKLVAQLLHCDIAAASPTFGVLFALYSVMQFLFAPVVGGLSDRFGRRTVLLPSLAGAAASYVLSALAPAISWLFVGRAIAGLTGASFSTATAYIADVTPPEKRAQSFGLVGAAFGLGFVVGPVVGGILGDINLRLPYVAAAVLNLLNFLYGLFVLPESLAPEARRPFSLERANPFGSLKNLARHPIVLGLTGTIVCGYMAQMILQSVWAISNDGRFGWNATNIGVSLGVVGVATALVQGALIRAVMPKLGEKRVLLGSLVVSVLSYVGLGLATRGWMIYAIIAPLALAGLAGPATQALISREVGASEQGELQGSLTSLASFTAIIGPLLGTGLFTHFGAADAVPHVPGAPFFAAAFFNAIGFVLAVRLFSRTPSLAT